MYHKFMANVGKHSSPTDPMGYYDFFVKEVQISTTKPTTQSSTPSFWEVVFCKAYLTPLDSRSDPAESRHVTNLSLNAL